MLRDDDLTVMEKAEVYLLVSMSRDRVQTDPRKTIRKLASKLVRRMQEQVSFVVIVSNENNVNSNN